MTFRQKTIKFLYPLIELVSGKRYSRNPRLVGAPQSFYNLQATANNGNVFHFDMLKGKKVLIVNTASDCAYTPQYKDLQQLYETFKNNLVVIAFPANDFKEQEREDDASIASFCEMNYGVQFPLMQKSIVVPGPDQHEVFQWLTQKEKNGWNSQSPQWNFCKYLVDENGRLIAYFGRGVSPLGKGVRKMIVFRQ